MLNSSGVLYVIATPIGNLADISQRALNILSTVDLIAAEDTRQTIKLLREYDIHTAMTAYHEYNESKEAPRLAALVANGTKLALVSDAGTPLISDPGFRLVREVKQLGLKVVPIPGPSALICALSASGLPSDRFLFIGFPPRVTESRQALFQSLATEPGTLIFYESGARLRATLLDLDNVFKEERRAVLAREITKRYETFIEGSPSAIAMRLSLDTTQIKGEHVLLVEGARHCPPAKTIETERILRILLEELPTKQAVNLTTRISGESRNDLYRLALTIEKQ